MDVGTNQLGYRWLVDDARDGKGYTARVWREDEDPDDDKPPRLAAARSGFSTREAAIEWASEATPGADKPTEAEQRRGLIALGVFGVLCLATLGLAVVRAITAPTVFNIGGVRETTREIRVIRPAPARPSGGGGRARPVPR